MQEKEDSPVQNGITRIKNIGNYRYLIYDDKWRLIIDTINNDTKITYTYYPDSIVLKYYENSHSISDVIIYHLNSAGLADSIYGHTKYNILQPEKRNYNADGYLSSKIVYNYVTNDVVNYHAYIISNGNIFYDSIIERTYDTTHLNSIGNEYMGLSFLGKSSRNPIITEKNTTPWYQKTINYTYTYDEKNRIKTVSTDGGASTTAYTYY